MVRIHRVRRQTVLALCVPQTSQSWITDLLIMIRNESHATCPKFTLYVANGFADLSGQCRRFREALQRRRVRQGKQPPCAHAEVNIVLTCRESVAVTSEHSLRQGCRTYVLCSKPCVSVNLCACTAAAALHVFIVDASNMNRITRVFCKGAPKEFRMFD